MPGDAETILTTERLVLRRLRTDEAATVAEYKNDPEVARFQDWDLPYPVEDIAAKIAVYVHRPWPCPGSGLNVAIEHDGELIGELTLVGPPIEGVADHHIGRAGELNRQLIPEPERIEEVAKQIGVGEPISVGNIADADGTDARAAQGFGDQWMLVRVPVVFGFEFSRQRFIVGRNDGVAVVAG